MEPEAANLQRLHDIVEPVTVSWWPLAPGWWFVFLPILAMWLVLGIRTLARRRANAYRRRALAELAGVSDAAAILEILRRTALAFAPREEVAVNSGIAWPDWLARHGPSPDPSLRTALADAAYRPESGDPALLRRYAEHWIRHHTPAGRC